MKNREANRRIVDTRNNLESIYERQRGLNNAAYVADLEKKQSEIDKKIQVKRLSNFKWISCVFKSNWLE
jgi:hypothetical protein